MTENDNITPMWVAIDVGCHECGVSSEVIGTFLTKDEAETAANAREEESGGWRDGGQSLPEVFGPLVVGNVAT